ncbi:hypothetical protein LXM50_17945 [Microbacterium sp. Au-Mic1]|uniref:hypothetical protein n=1 Tax=Microbacterium sp. Au-Mic1 TaxID=2906457 RepID=UPI001E39E51A|nr:hypothetical protein [Microbacterium sp. Au-Mic1]MCE4027861.1 hypothetical protein [Microbacterium sp. Au-Mic1]
MRIFESGPLERRTYVPKLLSSSNICQAFFEYQFRRLADTLEQIYRFRPDLGYGFDNKTPSRTTDIRIAARESMPIPPIREGTTHTKEMA